MSNRSRLKKLEGAIGKNNLPINKYHGEWTFVESDSEYSIYSINKPSPARRSTTEKLGILAEASVSENGKGGRCT